MKEFLKIDPPEVAEVAYPLSEFYARSTAAMPRFEVLTGSLVPQPFRRLLVHERDMTSTLEAFHDQRLTLRVLDKRLHGSKLVREVVLVGETDGRPAEFGAIRIQLDRFEPELRESILECRRPLGAILERYAIHYSCHPLAYFRVESDAVMRQALGADGAEWLFGRHNRLRGADGQTLADVVEILPPVSVEGELG